MAIKNFDEVLEREWQHVRAEDTATETIFRPTSYIERKNLRFRGAPETFTLKRDGTLCKAGSAPNDARQESEGCWKLKGNQLAFYMNSETNPNRVLEIISVEEDRLVVKK